LCYTTLFNIIYWAARISIYLLDSADIFFPCDFRILYSPPDRRDDHCTRWPLLIRSHRLPAAARSSPGYRCSVSYTATLVLRYIPQVYIPRHYTYIGIGNIYNSCEYSRHVYYIYTAGTSECVRCAWARATYCSYIIMYIIYIYVCVIGWRATGIHEFHILCVPPPPRQSLQPTTFECRGYNMYMYTYII